MPNPIKQIKQWKQRRDERPKEFSFAFGEQDYMDIISYGGMEEQPDYLIIDNQYVRTLFIAGYPHEASSGWIDALVNFPYNIDISYHVEGVDSQYALPKLRRRITQLEAAKRARIRDNKIANIEDDDKLESAIALQQKITRGQEKLYLVGVYIALSAESVEELEKVTKLLETTMASKMFFTRIAKYQQVEGLQTILPRGEDLLNQKRNLDSSSAALAFPFMSSELVQESGILYGTNKSSSSLVILDRFSLHNANSIVFANSGSGKSYMSKVEILRQLMQGTKVIVIDPEQEYKKLTESVDGTYVRIAAKSDEKINPFDLTSTAHDDEELAQHIQDLSEVISLMVDGLAKDEKAGVDKAMVAVYDKAKKGTQPLLRDFYAQLKNMGYHQLCNRLEKYTKGSASGILDSPTNIELNNRLVVFDTKELPKNLHRIMMMVIANFVQNTVLTKPEKRILVIDEGWTLLEEEQSARFISGLVRRARKYYLGVSMISQQARDFLKSDAGQGIASQSALRILMKQDSTSIKSVESEFGLSKVESKFLLTCGRGDALIIADQNHVEVNVVASDEEHPLITTNPAEVHGKK